jgi:curved DNA-binding protein CbpA
VADELVDFYRVLQVDPSADPEVVQAAYRVLARKLHPDLTSDETGMKTLNEAWDTLRDPERRKRYDRARGEAAVTAGAAPVPTPSMPKTYVPDHAGPPPGNPFGPVITFGRYEGWSIGEVARVDREFLEWLHGVPAGRGLRDEIQVVLGKSRTDPRFAEGLPEHRDLFKKT